MIRITVDHNHYIHQNGPEESQIVKLLKQILNINQNIMGIAEDLKAKVEVLQATIDDTQSQFIIKMATLEARVEELLEIIANGNNDPKLLEIGAAIEAATADLRTTFPEEPQPKPKP